MWVAMTAVGFVATGVIEDDNLKAGNPARLLNAMDYRGRICGYSDGVKDKDVGYFFPYTSSELYCHPWVGAVLIITCVCSCLYSGMS